LGTFFHPRNASRAHPVDLSVWQFVHGFGILYSSFIDGDKCERMAADVDIRDRLFDLRPVARHERAAGVLPPRGREKGLTDINQVIY
jgi:hypothetical protein